MAIQIEPVYPLHTSLDELLAPESLSKLLSKPVTRVERSPMEGHHGLAGGLFDYVDTDAGRLVLKRMSLERDWIMLASQDTQCRAVRLWQYGLLDRLHPHLEHGILACAQDEHAWAMLMDDLTGRFFAWDKPIPTRLIPVFLDSLARLHAIFWNDPGLKDARLGLCDLANLLDQTSPQLAREQVGDQLGVIPGWVAAGWQVMEELLDPDVFHLLTSLSENPAHLASALDRFPVTLLHGDYRSENLARLDPDRLVFIDWQEATYSLMTIDLTWFLTWVIRKNEAQEQAVRYYRRRLETYLGFLFADADWQAMIELGSLVDALRSTCFLAYWSAHGDIPENRRRDRRTVKLRNQQVHLAMRWL